MLTWLKETMKETWKQVIAVVVVATGLGAAIWAALKYLAGYVTDLVSTETTLGVLLLVILLTYILGRLNEKTKWKPKEDEIKVEQSDLVPIGPFKWEITLYSDGDFEISSLPFCKNHNTRLVEHWPLYFCPIDGNCPNISYTDLPVARQQAHSIMEAHLRKQKKNNT